MNKNNLKYLNDGTVDFIPDLKERVMWQVIEDMNFNERDHHGAGKYLVEDSGLNVKGIKEVYDFAVKKCDALYNKLFDVKGVSDDSYDDLRWQIVANGEEFYNNITLEKAQSMIDNNEYKESFAYAFHPAHDVIEDEWRFNERARQHKYLEECRQGKHGSFKQALINAFDKADNMNKIKLANAFEDEFVHVAPFDED